MVTRTETSLLLEPAAPEWMRRFVLRLDDRLRSVGDPASLQAQIDVLEAQVAALQAATTFRGALVRLSVSQNNVNFTAGSPTFGAYVVFDAEVYDTSGIHDNAVNNTRLTVPAGASKVRLTAQATLDNVTANEWVYLAVDKNGSATWVGTAQSAATLSNTAVRLNAVSPVVEVVPGDFFQMRIYIALDTAVTVSTTTTFAMEIVE